MEIADNGKGYIPALRKNKKGIVHFCNPLYLTCIVC